MGEIAAVILSAGESTRMKSPKMVLPYQGKTIIEKVIDNVEESDADKIIVVVGAEKELVTSAVNQRKVTVVVNDNYRLGMLSSVICGLKQIGEETDAALFFLGDQPWISPVVTNNVIDSFRSSGKGIVIPSYRGKRGHPLLVSSKYFREIEKLNSNIGLKELFLKFPHDIEEVETESPEILKDIDTPEDYQKEITK